MFQQRITVWHFLVWTILLTIDDDNNTLPQNVGINVFILEGNNAKIVIWTKSVKNAVMQNVVCLQCNSRYQWNW